MEIKEYKCPNCGGSVKFDSSIQKMKCPYCDTEFEIEALSDYQKQLAVPEKDNMSKLDTSEAGAAWANEELVDLSTGSCPSCGSELIGDANTIATVCPCCGNTQIVQKRIQGLMKPEYVLPFQLEKTVAVDALKQFYKNKRLLPNFFKEENQINNIQGLYVPFWLYDAKSSGNATFRATKIKKWSSGSYNYTKTEYYSVYREGRLDFQKVPVDGSTRMNDDYMDAIEPYDYGKLKDFQSDYLSGYIAEKYDIDVQGSKERAIKRMKNSLEDQFAKSAQGYSSVRKERSSVTVDNGKVSYSLLPVWILNTKYQEENYQFMMNGQSGRLIGKLPVDRGKAKRYRLMFLFGFGAFFTLIIELLRTFL